MMSSTINLSDIPQQIRQLAHFIKIANEYGTRDVVIQYWCLLKALEDGMKMSGNDPNTKKFLLDLMAILENMKQLHKDNDAIMQEIVAQSHIEDQAQRLFQFAYGLDQQGQFGQKVIKAFYTAGYLFDVLTCFGQLDENIQSAQRYAKWRAIDIHNCLKRGEQPKPAAADQTVQRDKDIGNDQDCIADQINEKLSAELSALNASLGNPQSSPVSQQQFNYPNGNFAGATVQGGHAPYPSQPHRPPAITGLQEPFRGIAHGHDALQTQQGTFATHSQHYPSKSLPARQTANKDAIVHQQTELTLEDYLEAKKLAKYAQSAMDYEDPKTAIDFLQKSIAVLQKRQQ